MIVHHASPDDFDIFKITEQGVHFGSIASAYEAVLRKKDSKDYFYLYTVELDTSHFIEELDQGHDWRKSFEKEPVSVKGYVYTNKYEPSTERSYVTWCEDVITILSKRKQAYLIEEYK